VNEEALAHGGLLHKKKERKKEKKERKRERKKERKKEKRSIEYSCFSNMYLPVLRILDLLIVLLSHCRLVNRFIAV
jgi:hypothetical protein